MAPLLTIPLTLRTTSPLFLGGATPNERAELRPPSIRGALRAWYRLLVGPVAAAQSEAWLFGAAGIAQSRVGVQLTRAVAPGTTSWAAPNASGRGYFGYALNMNPNRRMAIAAGTELPLRMTLRSGDEDHLKALVATAWAWVHLGGLGTRARRGLGSLSAQAWPTRGRAYPGGEQALPPLPNPAATGSPRECAQALLQGLRTLGTWGLLNAPESTDQPVYQLSTNAQVVVLGERGQPFQTWERALDTIGERMRDFRRQPGVDGLPTHFLNTPPHGAQHAPHRAAFGLPLAYRARGSQRVLLPHRKGKQGRMPSPLHIHLQSVRGGVLVVVTRLTGRLPGVHLDVVEQGHAQGFLRADEHNTILGRFVDSLGGVQVNP